MQPFADAAANAVQYGTQFLKSLGMPVDPKAAEAVADHLRGLSASTESFPGQKAEDHPVQATAGEAAGQILLYTATGTNFAQGLKAVPAAGRLLGTLLERGAQGAALGAITSKPGESVGANAFSSAIGSVFGEAAGQTAGKAAALVANSTMVSRLINQARKAGQAWTSDSIQLASHFKTVLDNVNATTIRLNGRADSAKIAEKIANGGTAPANWSKATQALIDKAKQYQDDTKFYQSKVFRKLSLAGQERTGLPGETFPKEANDQILKTVMGDDRQAAKTVYDGATPYMRTLIRKGIFANAIEDASTAEGKIDPVKLRNKLSSRGVETFFGQGTGGKNIATGLANLVEEGNSVVSRHPYILAHGIGRLSTALVGAATLEGGAYGYERYRGGGEDVERGAAQFALFFGMIYGASHMMNSQAGLNLLSAAAKVKPGTPQAGKVLAKFFQMTGAPMGAQLSESLLGHRPAAGDETQ